MKPQWALLVAVLFACQGDEESPPGHAEEATVSPQPHRVLLEIDRMEGVAPVQMTQTLGGRRISLVEIYRAAGIELRIVEDETDIPVHPSLRPADLHRLMIEHASVAPEPGEWKGYLLLAKAYFKPGVDGVMFDYGVDDENGVPREIFAVFEEPIRNRSAELAPEMLLTTAHELAHLLNLHHADWEGDRFSDHSTIESYSDAGSVRWNLSERSIRHLGAHPPMEVQPGMGGLAFKVVTQAHLDDHQDHPRDSYEVFDPIELAGSRTQNPRLAVTLESDLAVDGPDANVLPAGDPLALRLHVPAATFVVGEPVVLTVELVNTGSEPREVLPLLDPEYGFLGVQIRGPADAEFRPYHPIVLEEGRGIEPRVLAPNEALVAEARVFYGAGGWNFEAPGRYVVRADFPVSLQPEAARILSDSLVVLVVEPTTDDGRQARELLVAPSGVGLDAEAGLFLYLEGGDHLTAGRARLERVVESAPTAPQASASRVALGIAALNPSGSQTVEPAQLEAARRYLDAVDVAAVSPLSVLRATDALSTQLRVEGQVAEAQAVQAQAAQEVQQSPATQKLHRPAVIRRVP